MDRFWRWLAWKMPRRLVFWCASRLFSHAAMDTKSGDEMVEMNWIDAIHKWNEQSRLVATDCNSGG
jgi:hypothetical protein